MTNAAILLQALNAAAAIDTPEGSELALAIEMTLDAVNATERAELLLNVEMIGASSYNPTVTAVAMIAVGK